MEDYGFVPHLPQNTPKDFLPAGHTDCILRESLTGPYANLRGKDPKVLKSYLMTSFFDLLPPQLQDSPGIFVRGEFLYLRKYGNDKHLGDEQFLDFTEALAKKMPPHIIYRLTDYNTDEFNFLSSDGQGRGAQRLLSDRALLEREQEVLKIFKRTGKNVSVLVPYARSVHEYRSLCDVVEVPEHNMGLMIENFASLSAICDFLPLSHIMYGPSDLAAEHQGVSRTKIDIQESQDTVIAAVDAANAKITQACTVYPAKILIPRIRRDFPTIHFISVYTPPQVYS